MGVRKQACWRGHDTSYPEARNNSRECRECARIKQQQWITSTEKGREYKRNKDKRYSLKPNGIIARAKARKNWEQKNPDFESRPERVYSQYKAQLKRNIVKRDKQIEELESLLVLQLNNYKELLNAAEN